MMEEEMDRLIREELAGELSQAEKELLEEANRLTQHNE